ncbi:hypothetical protein IJ579_05305 [bacterium]|nr:hypothetical protein [bacterium]
MRLNKMLHLWVMHELISKEQEAAIKNFMKERSKENFFRLLKWLSIIGALYVIFGVIATVISFLKLDFMMKFLAFLVKMSEGFFVFLNTYFIQPVYNILYGIFGDNYGYFIFGICSLILFFLFRFLSEKYKPAKDVDSLNLSDEQKYVLKTNFVFDTLSAMSLGAVFCFFNMLLIPHNAYYSAHKIFPFWNLAGAATFTYWAYRARKVMYLLFGIYFVCLSAGVFAGYGYASYWIGVSKPVVTIFLSIILLLIGYITELKNQNDDFIREKFSSAYNWTGLLMLFLSLWIASFWGFDIGLSEGSASTSELWFANLLFIAASIGAMYYGTQTEKKLFFNYGLTFLIIETYTVFCSRLWDYMPAGLASLLLGVMIIATVKMLKKIYLKKKN